MNSSSVRTVFVRAVSVLADLERNEAIKGRVFGRQGMGKL